MNTLQLNHMINTQYERDLVLAQLRARGQERLAAAAERLWSALNAGAKR